MEVTAIHARRWIFAFFVAGNLWLTSRASGFQGGRQVQTKVPPVPPANRNPKDRSASGTESTPQSSDASVKKPENINQVGERANIRQNAMN